MWGFSAKSTHGLVWRGLHGWVRISPERERWDSLAADPQWIHWYPALKAWMIVFIVELGDPSGRPGAARQCHTECMGRQWAAGFSLDGVQRPAHMARNSKRGVGTAGSDVTSVAARCAAQSTKHA